jgi:N6-adenosine-specific RNA methylase IME4
MLDVAFEVIEAWNFEYKTCGFVWVKSTDDDETDDEKTSLGQGYWTRSNVELVLFATRGNPMRMDAGVRQVVMAPRLAHSEKPDEVYDRIRRLVTGPYLEMFARKQREGWDAWGNEVDEKAEAA